VIRRDQRRAALVARHHLGRSAPHVHRACRDLVAIHSSDPLTPHIGLWARVPDYRPDHLEAHTPDSLWRLHAMRRTLWVACREEVGLLDAAVGQTVAARERRRLLGCLLRDDAETWLASLSEQVVAAVAAAPGVHTRQLTKELPELATKIQVGSGKWVTEVAISSRLLFLLAMELRLARTASTGTWKASQYGWRVAPEVTPVDPALARGMLVGRYLERFGPVTTTDVRWWTGMTAAQVKRAVADIGAVEVELEEGTGWVAKEAPLPEAEGVALLPGLDPTPMGYKERSWFLGDHQAALFDRNGNVGPTVWVDGRIVGGWAVDAEGRVRHRLLDDVGERAAAEVGVEGERLTEWLDGLSVTPRFRTPLEKELV